LVSPRARIARVPSMSVPPCVDWCVDFFVNSKGTYGSKVDPSGANSRMFGKWHST
jgi:hypothetical protein